MRSIEISNLGKLYSLEATTIRAIVSGYRTDNKRFWALRNITFDVEQGEILGIVGHNGSGKSTLLSILAGIINPTEGKAVLHGSCLPVLQVGIGFNPDFSGEENLFQSGKLIGIDKQRLVRDFDEMVEFAGLRDFLRTPIKHYSAGMQTRLALTVSMQLEADIMLIDEVLTAGDLSFQDKCMDRMHRLAKSGKTLLIVSHALGHIEELCSRVVWLEKGRILEIGATDDIMPKYKASQRAI